MPRLPWNASKRRVPRNASRRTRSVQRSPMTESVRAIVQSSLAISLQRTRPYSSKMELMQGGAVALLVVARFLPSRSSQRPRLLSASLAERARRSIISASAPSILPLRRRTPTLATNCESALRAPAASRCLFFGLPASSAANAPCALLDVLRTFFSSCRRAPPAMELPPAAVIASSIARSWHRRSSLPCSGVPARQVPVWRSQVVAPLHASPSSHCSSPVHLPVGSVVLLEVGSVVVVATPPQATLVSSEASGARPAARRVALRVGHRAAGGDRGGGVRERAVGHGR